MVACGRSQTASTDSNDRFLYTRETVTPVTAKTQATYKKVACCLFPIPPGNENADQQHCQNRK